MARLLDDQKLALTIEKLAIASEISGPDLASTRQPKQFPPPARSEEWPAFQSPVEEDDDQPPLAECSRLQAVPAERTVPNWLLGLLAALVAMVAVAAAVMTAR
jgi:hypothetical protein